MNSLAPTLRNSYLCSSHLSRAVVVVVVVAVCFFGICSSVSLSTSSSSSPLWSSSFIFMPSRPTDRPKKVCKPKICVQCDLLKFDGWSTNNSIEYHSNRFLLTWMRCRFIHFCILTHIDYYNFLVAFLISSSIFPSSFQRYKVEKKNSSREKETDQKYFKRIQRHRRGEEQMKGEKKLCDARGQRTRRK